MWPKWPEDCVGAMMGCKAYVWQLDSCSLAGRVPVVTAKLARKLVREEPRRWSAKVSHSHIVMVVTSQESCLTATGGPNDYLLLPTMRWSGG